MQNSPWVSLGQAEPHGKAALYKVEFPSAACRPGSGWKPGWRPRPHSSGNRHSTGCSAPRSWREAGLVCSEDHPSGAMATAWCVSRLKTTRIWSTFKSEFTVMLQVSASFRKCAKTKLIHLRVFRDLNASFNLLFFFKLTKMSDSFVDMKIPNQDLFTPKTNMHVS